MRKVIIFAGLMLFVTGVAGICHAAAIGPVEPLGPLKVSIGPEYNSTSGRDLDKASDTDLTGGEVKASNQPYLEISLGIGNHANAYTRFGAANLEQRLDWSNGRNQTIKYDYGFLWGLGGNYLFDIGNNFGIGGDAQFNTWACDARSISGSNDTFFTEKGSMRAYEYQVAAYITYKQDVGVDSNLIPYLGGYYTYFKINTGKDNKFEDNDYGYINEGSIKGRDKFGVLAGCDMKASEHLYIKLQGRFIAETAGTIGVSCRY